jgi:hypothetical protein
MNIKVSKIGRMQLQNTCAPVKYTFPVFTAKQQSKVQHPHKIHLGNKLFIPRIVFLWSYNYFLTTHLNLMMFFFNLFNIFYFMGHERKNFTDHTAISVSLHKTVYESILLSEDLEGEKQVGVIEHDSI